MSYHQTRQMPLQVQKSLREASIRSMLIQRQMVEARQHFQDSLLKTSARMVPVQIPVSASEASESAEVNQLKDLLAHWRAS